MYTENKLSNLPYVTYFQEMSIAQFCTSITNLFTKAAHCECLQVNSPVVLIIFHYWKVKHVNEQTQISMLTLCGSL